ncbi:DUF6924 domain-containing protein [Nucisporomicrobium flavum]|uniref:DUF6924 domain-containing protein n=1 Tax=Nucisporomicrobium flavum TaxID=2785915 RepID=UPI003C2EC1C1
MRTPIWHGNPDVSLVIRTDFDHEPQWARIRSAIEEPQTEDGFTALVSFVDDRAYEGLTAARLLEIAPADASHSFAFLVDTVALTTPDQPILVVKLGNEGQGSLDGDTFRVVPSEMWSVQNNLSRANMDWAEFAAEVDRDGVFRGFP